MDKPNWTPTSRCRSKFKSVFDQKGNLVSAKSPRYSEIFHYSLEVKLNENGQYIWNEDTTEGTQAGAYGKIQKIINYLADLLGQIDSKISIPEEYGIKGGLMSAPETADPETPKPQIVDSNNKISTIVDRWWSLGRNQQAQRWKNVDFC